MDGGDLSFVRIGVSNYRIALEKQQPNIIYQLCLAILKQYSFFNAFTRIADVPEIYMQQFWHTISLDLNTQTYFFMLDDQRFKVGEDLLRDALQITPKDPDHPFVEPPPHDEIVSFIKKLGYPGSPDQIDSRKISAKKKELLPFPKFMKLIIKYILSHHNNVSKRPQSDKHAIKLDAVLGNLKFANKGEKDPIYGMAIPKEFLLNIKKASKDDYIIQQRHKGLGKGSSIVLDTPNEPSDSSSSSHLGSDDEEGFMTTDDEAIQEKSNDERTNTDVSKKAEDKKAEDDKDADEKAREEQDMDDQDGIEQAG
ncbi:hypothetical protein Tco_1301626 [Tanacetum coccineum]